MTRVCSPFRMTDWVTQHNNDAQDHWKLTWLFIREQKCSLDKEFNCTACSLGKLIIRPSKSKIVVESPAFLERIQGDICGPIAPPCGPFRYFMVLIDASTRWSHVSLLPTRNAAFAKLLAQIIRLRAQFPDYTVKKIRLDKCRRIHIPNI